MPRPLLLDASAVVPWFVPEEMTPVAELLLESDRPLLAPRHLLGEVTNAILTQERRGRLPRGHAAQAWMLLRGMGAGLRRPGLTFLDEGEAPVFGRAIAIAERQGHALYDCFYLALAEREGATLATFDRRMAELARRLSVSLWASEAA